MIPRNTIKIVKNGKIYDVSYKYDPEFISIIKQVPGRFWDTERKVWTIPDNMLGWFISKTRKTRYENIVEIYSDDQVNVNARIGVTTKEDIPNIDISDIDVYVQDGYKLYEHQYDFLRFAKSRCGKGFLLADDMGCGKTLEVINYTMYRRKVDSCKHCLIICCVNSAKFSWQDDIRKHTNGSEDGYILGTRKRRGGGYRYTTGNKERLDDLVVGHMYGDVNAPELPYFIILNVEALRYECSRDYIMADRIVELIESGEIGIIAIDEIHKNTSASSAQGKIISKIKKMTGTKAEWIPMTGTPIVNRPTDLYLPLQLVDAHNYKTFGAWEKLFRIAGGYGNHNTVAYKNIPQLSEMLHSHMIRRLKTDVLDLPPKIQYTEYVENTPIQRELYYNIRAVIAERVEANIDIPLNPLALFTRLRQVNGSPEIIDPTIAIDKNYIRKNAKLLRTLLLVQDIIDRGEKVVIFSNWVEPLKVLYRFLASKYKTAYFTGTMSVEQREAMKQEFISDPDCKIILGTIGAMGVNQTFTVANNVIFYDSPWDDATRTQCEDRCYRIGSKKTLNVYTIITKDTVDDRVHEIMNRKRCISSFIVDGRLDVHNNPDLLKQLLRI